MSQKEFSIRHEPARFRVLDGWRGLSALLVALFHLPVPGHFYIMPFIRGSYLFVDFFFVLSGFIISHAYMDKVRQPGGMRSFVIRRFGRLWPMHIAMLAMFIVAILAINGVTHLLGLTSQSRPFWLEPGNNLVSVFTNIFFIHSLGIHNVSSWNTPSWSVSVEFWIYILFGFLCVTLQARLGLVAAIAAVAGAVGLVLYGGNNYINVSYGYGIFRGLYGFFTGHLVYRLWRNTRDLPISHGTLLEVLSVILVISFVSRAATGFLSLAAPIVFAFVVFVFSHEKGLVSRALSTIAVRKLGDWSYSIYMVHALVALLLLQGIRILEAATGVELIPDKPVPGVGHGILFYVEDLAMNLLALGYLAAVVAIAALTYRYIEQPGRRFFNGFAEKKAAGLSSVSSARY